jgi:hypothetical protein
MQNEAGVPNDYSNKLNNYLTNGAINGNFESGREAGFANMMSKLNAINDNSSNISKKAIDLDKIQRLDEQREQLEPTKRPYKLYTGARVRGLSGKPLRVEPVQPKPLELEDDPRQKSLEVENLEPKKREFIGYPKDDEGKKAGVKGSLISLPKKTERTASLNEESSKVKERVETIEKQLKNDMQNDLYESVLKNYKVKEYFDKNPDVPFDKTDPSSDDNLRRIYELIRDGKITKKGEKDQEEVADVNLDNQLRLIEKNQTLGSYLSNKNFRYRTPDGREKKINLSSIEKLSNSQKQEIIADQKAIPFKKGAGRRSGPVIPRYGDDEED